MDKKKILDNFKINKKIKRISLQIIECNIEEKEIVLVGIKKNGYLLAKKILDELKKNTDFSFKICSLKINKKQPFDSISCSLEISDYKNKSIIIIDDVLNSGSTLMYAVKYFLDTKITQLKTVVLVDRNHKKFPIKVDFKGVSLSTAIQNHVEVIFENDKIEAFLH
tara:strand:- start:3803 stop:4300 length:498 start_codon:yes stop_codon:yes gene_type:complete